jgi:hypothetical protein
MIGPKFYSKRHSTFVDDKFKTNNVEKFEKERLLASIAHSAKARSHVLQSFEEHQIHQEVFEQKIFDAYSTAQLSTTVLAKSRVYPRLA